MLKDGTKIGESRFNEFGVWYEIQSGIIYRFDPENGDTDAMEAGKIEEHSQYGEVDYHLYFDTKDMGYHETVYDALWWLFDKTHESIQCVGNINKCVEDVNIQSVCSLIGYGDGTPEEMERVVKAVDNLYHESLNTYDEIGYCRVDFVVDYDVTCNSYAGRDFVSMIDENEVHVVYVDDLSYSHFSCDEKTENVLGF